MVAGTTPSAVPEPELLVGGDEDRTRRRRWRWLLLALVVLAALAVQPVLGHLNAAGLGDLRDLWAERTSYDIARDSALAAVESVSVPSDGPAVDRAAAALDREEATRLGALRQRINDVTVLDGSLRSVRAVMTSALSGQISDLGRAAASGSSDALSPGEQAYAAINAAQRQLTGAEHSYHVTASTSPTNAVFHAADPTIAAFHRYLDVPTGGLRLVVSDTSLAMIDLDARRTHDLSIEIPSPDIASPSVIAGQLVGTFDNGQGPTTYAVPLSPDQSPRILGRGAAIPAPGRAAVWLVDAGGVRLVDLTGRVLLPRTTLPPGAATTGVSLYTGVAVRAGLVLYPKPGDVLIPTGLIVWDPLTRRTVRTVTTGCAQVLGSWEDLLAWRPTPCSQTTGSPPPAALHLYDTATGADRTITGADHVYAITGVTMGAFSPDGRHLALFQVPATGDPQLSIVDVATATTRSVPAASQSDQYGAPPIWAPDSRRVFYDAGPWQGPTGQGQPRELFATYRIGDPAAMDLRMPTSNYELMLAVLGPG